MVNTTSDMSERILRCRYSVQYTTVFQSKYWYDTGQVCYTQYGARIRLITWVRTMGVDHTHTAMIAAQRAVAVSGSFSIWPLE